MSQEVLEELEAFVQEESEPVATASEIAERVEIGRRSVLERLSILDDLGEVGSKKVGAGARVFWPIGIVVDRVQNGVDEHPPDAGGEIGHQEQSDSKPRETPQDRPEVDLGGLDLPSNREAEAMGKAILAARAYLEREGSASMREIVRDVMPEEPIGYDVDAAIETIEAGDRYRGAWWRRVVRPGLAALDDIEKPQGGGEWRYTGN